MKRFILSTSVLLAIGCLFNSCFGDCYCMKDLGCTILTVKKIRGTGANTVILTKTFCSQTNTNYNTDRALRDSADAFRNRYYTDSTIVETKDSIYKHYDEIKTRHNLQQYTDSGYSCNCPR